MCWGGVGLPSVSWLVVLLACWMAAFGPSMTSAQTAPATVFIGFSPRVPPADALAFRQAIGYAFDRYAIAQALGSSRARPAASIQHSQLPGYNPAVRGFTFDSVKAKDLYNQSGWRAPITILVGPAATDFLEVLYGTVTESLSKTLRATINIGRVANFQGLVKAAQSGNAPIWMHGWRSDPKDYGYPSFALGLAQEYFLSDLEIKVLVDRMDTAGTEQMLLDKALIIPIVHY